MFKKMIHRKALLRCLVFGVLSTALLVALGVTITKNNENDTSAAAGTRSFTLKVGDYVYVNDVSYYDSYGTKHSIKDYTHYYTASGFTGEGDHGIFCVQPLNSTPTAGTLTAKEKETSNDPDDYAAQLKLLLFIYRYYDRFDFVEEARHAVMESPKTATNYNYFWVHMLASWLMSTYGDTDVWPSKYPWQNVAYYYNSKSPKGWFRRASDRLAQYIRDNNILWRFAKEQTLYESTNTSQRLMFIGEGNFIYHDITAQKCDAATNSCSDITPGASLQGIKFKLVNASTETVYDFSTGKSYEPGDQIGNVCKTNSAGKCVFSHLPAYGYKYKVVEVGANSSYTLPADRSQRAQTVTLNNQNLDLNFYDSPRTTGKISVQKCDAELNEIDGIDDCGPQGNASLEGIRFDLYKIENGERIHQATEYTNESGEVEFDNLSFENVEYVVREETSNESYVLNAEEREKTVTLTPEHQTDELIFHDNPVLGSIRIYKKDSETGTCETSKGSSFAGTTFEIINRSNRLIEYNNQVFRQKEVIAELIFERDFIVDGDQCYYEISGLPYGKYQVKETNATPGYKKAASVTVTIPTQNEINVEQDIINVPTFELGTKAADADDEDNYVEADGEAKIIDHVDYCAHAGENYVLKGTLMDKETGKAIEVGDERVESLVKFTTQEACGRVDMEFIFDASELGGHDVVVFETLYEEGEEGDGEPIISHEDIEDEDQTVHMVYIHTTAVNDEDDSKVLPMNEDVVIKDTVDYCLNVGEPYIIRGVLMDRAENAPLLINGEMVQSEVAVTPEERCGQAVMYFHINTTGLSGKRLVVFESLYLVDEPDEPIIKHEDIYNYDESIDVEPEVPDTGIATKSGLFGGFSNGTFAIMGGVVIVSLGGYLFTRYSSKKNAMKF